MTEVAFHTGLVDKLGYACRLLRKAWRQGVPVVATAAPELLQRLDVQLWTFEQEEFVPHARWRAGDPIDPVLARTPIWLVDEPARAPTRKVLVNLGPGVVEGYQGYDRVVELVSDDAQDARLGRQRWRRYQGDGLVPRLHQQSARATGEADA